MGNRRRQVRSVAAVTVVLAACGPVSTAAAAAGSPAKGPAATTGVFTCLTDRPNAMVQGDPHITSVPPIRSVQLTPSLHGLVISYKFRSTLELAPEGVYFAWTVYLYRHRSDAGDAEDVVQLQVQDRGKGWEPAGWTIVASTYTQDSPVEGNVHTDKARDELTTFFPAGFADLQPPFYWFASQEEYRAYLPQDNKAEPRDWNVNGSIVTDCPAGVRPDPNSLPFAAKLLSAGG